jgi:hypothetical protein
MNIVYVVKGRQFIVTDQKPCRSIENAVVGRTAYAGEHSPDGTAQEAIV